jgi:hypothetical protein
MRQLIFVVGQFNAMFNPGIRFSTHTGSLYVYPDGVPFPFLVSQIKRRLKINVVKNSWSLLFWNTVFVFDLNDVNYSLKFGYEKYTISRSDGQAIGDDDGMVQFVRSFKRIEL